MSTFQELGLREEILTALAELGYENPMPVPAQVIPFMLIQPSDLVALAKTGTGKTAGCGLPVLNMIDPQSKQIQSLILAPTRELCIQIANDLKNYSSKMRGTKIVPVYGGESIVIQLRQLDTPPQVLVATPGRLIDLIRRGTVKLDAVRYLVLDEADEMLNMGFQDDLETILKEVPTNRRTLLFSATMPKEIARIAKNYMTDHEEIEVGTRNSGSNNVEHVFYMVQASNRYLALKRIVDMNPDVYGIIFCRTRQETKDVAEKLMKDGYNADALHGDLSQAQRDTVMGKFRFRNLQLLVATDVAARGLDVSDLTHVINYNLPDDVEVYTHRSGRTGRANKKGTSVSIIHTRERNRIREIERIIKREFKQLPVPNGMDICKRQLFHMIDRMEQVEVNHEQIDPFMDQVNEKLEYLSKEDLLRRFVSLEFNRFLEYYKNAQDLNVPDRKESRQRDDFSGRGERSDRGKGGRRGNRVRFKLPLGHKQNTTARSILGLINETTNDKSISVGDIEVTNKFTFFDVFADQAERVMRAFEENAPSGLRLTVAEERPRNNEYRGNRESRGYERNDRSRNDRSDSRNRRSGGYRDSSARGGNAEKPWRRRNRA